MRYSHAPLDDDHEIECANCGARFYYELTRCPNCGVNLYEPEEKYDLEEPPSGGFFSRAGDFLGRLFGRFSAEDRLFGASLRQAILFNDLLAKAGGDRTLVERLVDEQRRRKPRANRTVWLQAALQRWEREHQDKV